MCSRGKRMVLMCLNKNINVETSSSDTQQPVAEKQTFPEETTTSFDNSAEEITSFEKTSSSYTPQPLPEETTTSFENLPEETRSFEKPGCSRSQNEDSDYSLECSSDEWVPLEEQLRLSSSEEEENIDPYRLQDSRKRKRGHGPMQRKLRKERILNKKLGLAYVTSKGKNIEARMQKPLPECKLKCKSRLDCKHIEQLYISYRSLINRNSQRQFLSSLMLVKPKGRETKSNNIKNRSITTIYNIDQNGTLISVCKSCFLCIFGETRGFIEEIIKKKKTGESSIISEDLRGKHAPAIKKSDSDIESIHAHIKSFPAYKSHYTRRKDTQKNYLPSNLNLNKMYQLYVESTTEKQCKPVSLSLYRQIFLTHNLKFKKPSKDSCKTCDSYTIKIKAATDEMTKNVLKEEHAFHQTMADTHYNIKRIDKETALKSSDTIVVAVFDLQKCLETPSINTSVSFYKRKLWTFNLTVRNCNSRETYCYMWHEGIANRGANEVASCLYKFIMGLPDATENVIFYSDTCPGQNRNTILPLMFSYVIQIKPGLKEINHKFLVPGHTHLECDSDHALIERFRKQNSGTIIAVPQDWVTFVQLSSRKFKTISMQQSDFYGFSKLFSTFFQKKTVDIEKCSFNWLKIFWVHIVKEDVMGTIRFKFDLGDGPFRTCSLNRRGRPQTIQSITLNNAYENPLIIDKKKYVDIISLMQYIDPIYHDFYKNLRNAASVQCEDTDSEDEYEE